MGSKARGVEIVDDSPHGTVVKAMFVRCCRSGEPRSNLVSCVTVRKRLRFWYNTQQ